MVIKFSKILLKKENLILSLDWKKYKPYPYKDNTLSDPKYIKDRAKLFAENGNGWWWGDGWWNGHYETQMEYNRRKRKEKENG